MSVSSIVHLIVRYVWEMNTEVVCECFMSAVRRERPGGGLGSFFGNHVYFAEETADVIAPFSDASSS